MFKRKCPNCNKELVYTTETALRHAYKKNSCCLSCTKKKLYIERPDLAKDISKRNKGYKHNDNDRKKMSTRQKELWGGESGVLRRKTVSENYIGENNPFYGKRHTDETKQKIRENYDYSILNSEEARKKKSEKSKGENNPMYGKSIYSVWVEKYGKEEADIKMSLLKEKKRQLSSGKNNPMYGKPSPQGSGNGWSGWYKGKYFRSIMELSYIVEYLEKNNLKWISAETKELMITYYDHNEVQKNYFADFLVENKRLVEIKPLKLQTSVNNILKHHAAKIFCEERGLQFEVLEWKKLSVAKILLLVECGDIIFLDRYKEKLTEWRKKNDGI